MPDLATFLKYFSFVALICIATRFLESFFPEFIAPLLRLKGEINFYIYSECFSFTLYVLINLVLDIHLKSLL